MNETIKKLAIEHMLAQKVKFLNTLGTNPTPLSYAKAAAYTEELNKWARFCLAQELDKRKWMGEHTRELVVNYPHSMKEEGHSFTIRDDEELHISYSLLKIGDSLMMYYTVIDKETKLEWSSKDLVGQALSPIEIMERMSSEDTSDVLKKSSVFDPETGKLDSNKSLLDLLNELGDD